MSHTQRASAATPSCHEHMVGGNAYRCATGKVGTVLTSPQVSRMAVELAVCLHLRHTHHLLLVERNIMVLAHWRLVSYWLPYHACISGWYVCLLFLGTLLITVYIASTLDRYELPFFGSLATSITDDE